MYEGNVIYYNYMYIDITNYYIFSPSFYSLTTASNMAFMGSQSIG